MSVASPFDQHMMAIALAMARRGVGSTAPNPSVGAVVADPETGEVIARGWTQPGGRPHAEKEALSRAGERARGKTMYVTLEPCAHTGRVPTCSNSILTSGIARVVCALPDPNPVVAGHGFAQLREAGVEVDVGLMGNAARWVTIGHILRQTARRPFVQLKMALGSDGAVARGHGSPVWVTGTAARDDGHLLRAETDAILVGGETARVDDPSLTCRLPGLAKRSPIRVVLSARTGLDTGSRLVASARELPTWLITDTLPGVVHDKLVAAGIVIRTVPDVPAIRPWLSAVLETLAQAGITRLLVEGGPATWARFLASGTVDEVVAYVGHEAAPTGSIPVAPAGDVSAFLALHGLRQFAENPLGPDRRLTFRRADR